MKQFENSDDIPQTISLSYQEICTGTDPWIALDSFVHDFFVNYRDQRSVLIKDAIKEPIETNATADLHRWAIFCAASVESLSQKYNLLCPEWVNKFTSLAEPWYFYPVEDKPQARESLIKKTPEPFARRHIFCGESVFNNKYEAAENLRCSAL